jgi:hypothetical protein
MADKKVSELSAITNLSGDDLLLVVNDPNGTPVSNKVTINNLFANVVPSTTFKANTVFSGTQVTVSANLVLGGTNVLDAINNRYSIANTNAKFLANADFNATIADYMQKANTLSIHTTTKQTLASGLAVNSSNTTTGIHLSNNFIKVFTNTTEANASAPGGVSTVPSQVILYADIEGSNTKTTTLQSQYNNNMTANVVVKTPNESGVIALTSQLTQYHQTANATIEGLTDTSIATLGGGDTLSYDGTTWRNVQSPSMAFQISANGTSAYEFSGSGAEQLDQNPTLYLYKGFTYYFNNGAGNTHPFTIVNTYGGDAYSNGVSGDSNTSLVFTVPQRQIANLYYECSSHPSTMRGILVIK